MVRRSWPRWWDWEIELSPHLIKRMLDRRFSEVELRSMMERALKCRPDIVEGRWIIVTNHRRLVWEVIVEPDPHAHRLVIVTAYPLEEN